MKKLLILMMLLIISGCGSNSKFANMNIEYADIEDYKTKELISVDTNAMPFMKSIPCTYSFNIQNVSTNNNEKIDGSHYYYHDVYDKIEIYTGSYQNGDLKCKKVVEIAGSTFDPQLVSGKKQNIVLPLFGEKTSELKLLQTTNNTDFKQISLTKKLLSMSTFAVDRNNPYVYFLTSEDQKTYINKYHFDKGLVAKEVLNTNKTTYNGLYFNQDNNLVLSKIVNNNTQYNLELNLYDHADIEDDKLHIKDSTITNLLSDIDKDLVFVNAVGNYLTYSGLNDKENNLYQLVCNEDLKDCKAFNSVKVVNNEYVIVGKADKTNVLGLYLVNLADKTKQELISGHQLSAHVLNQNIIVNEKERELETLNGFVTITSMSDNKVDKVLNYFVEGKQSEK